MRVLKGLWLLCFSSNQGTSRLPSIPQASSSLSYLTQKAVVSQPQSDGSFMLVLGIDLPFTPEMIIRSSRLRRVR